MKNRGSVVAQKAPALPERKEFPRHVQSLVDCALASARLLEIDANFVQGPESETKRMALGLADTLRIGATKISTKLSQGADLDEQDGVDEFVHGVRAVSGLLWFAGWNLQGGTQESKTGNETHYLYMGIQGTLTQAAARVAK